MITYYELFSELISKNGNRLSNQPEPSLTQ